MKVQETKIQEVLEIVQEMKKIIQEPIEKLVNEKLIKPKERVMIFMTFSFGLKDVYHIHLLIFHSINAYIFE